MPNEIKTVKEKVAELIAKSGENVTSIVVNELAQVEINKRVEAIKKTMVKEEDFKKELVKINKPDLKTFPNADLSTGIESYSEPRIKEIQTLKKKIEDLNKLCDKALETNKSSDYDALYKFLN